MMSIVPGDNYVPRPVTVDLSQIANPFIFVTECLRNGSYEERVALSRVMTLAWARSRNTQGEAAVDQFFDDIWMGM